jgi:uncharacterized protein
MPTTLIAGGSGLVGSRLRQLLADQGHQVRLLTRKPRPDSLEYYWDPQAGKIDAAVLTGVDYLVNLAGAGIADKRWTAARKRELVESRTSSNAVLAKAIADGGHRLKSFVSASAIGYYGDSGERLMHEDDAPVDDSFMVHCCREWENSAEAIAAQGIRTTVLRIGVVMAKESGAFAEFAKPMRFGVGAYFGNGSAWNSWIHRDDLCQMIVWALENDGIAGTFNAVSPQPVRGKALVAALQKAMNAPALLVPAPEIAIRLAFGEMSAVVLNSNRVSAEKILAAGFRFQYEEIGEALAATF